MPLTVPLVQKRRRQLGAVQTFLKPIELTGDRCPEQYRVEAVSMAAPVVNCFPTIFLKDLFTNTQILYRRTSRAALGVRSIISFYEIERQFQNVRLMQEVAVNPITEDGKIVLVYLLLALAISTMAPVPRIKHKRWGARVLGTAFTQNIREKSNCGCFVCILYLLLRAIWWLLLAIGESGLTEYYP
jgi:hypothetical protein